jgi:hypothetical protein
MQENDANIIVVTEDIYWEAGLVGHKTRKKAVWKQVKLELINVSKISWLICSPCFVSIFQRDHRSIPC